MRLEQRGADRSAELGDERVNPQAGNLKRDPASQRVAVGVKPGGRQADQRVAGPNRSTVDQPFARNHSDNEPGDIVLAISVEAGHLGGLAAEERTAIFAAGARQAFDDLDGHIRFETACCEIVEKKERLRALHEDVVDAVVDEIDADRSMDAGLKRDSEFGADAIRTGDENGIVHLCRVEAEQSAEGSNLGENAGGERAARQRADPPHDLVASLDVDAGLLVVHTNSRV